VGDAHSRICGVHALTAWSGGTKDIDPQILIFDLEIDFLRFGQHGDGGGRRVNSALTLGDRYTLHAMHTGFPTHRAEGAFALDLEDGFLHAAKSTSRLGNYFYAPAPPFGEAGVHAIEIGGKYGRFVAAGTATNLDDRRLSSSGSWE